MNATTEERPAVDLLYRFSSIDAAALRSEQKTLRVCFSSESPVLRRDGGERYYEILDHDAANCDIALLQDRGAFLDEHNFERQVGSIETAWIDRDRKGRADLSFADTDLGQERRTLMTEGHRKGISFGYIQTKMLNETRGADGIPIRRFAWKAYEISSVAVGADQSAGVGRSNQFQRSSSTQNKHMQVTEQPPSQNHEISALATEFEKDFPHIIGDIRSAKIRALAEEIAPKDFARSIMQLTQANPAPKTLVPVAAIGMSAMDVNRYSFTRAIRSVVENGKVEGFEAECSQQVERNSKVRAEGFLVPLEVVVGASSQQRDMQATVFPAGGALVPTQVVPPIIELLRNRTICTRLGATMLAGLSGNVLLPRQISPTTMQTLLEIGLLNDSNPTFDQLPATPHRVGATVTYSKQLVFQSLPSVEAFVRDDLMQQLAIKHDSLLLTGQGANSEPIGIINTSGVGSITFGGTVTWQDILNIESELGVANADAGAMAFATTPLVKAAWKGTAVALTGATTVSSAPIWANGNFADGSNDGIVNGYRAASTNQIPSNLVLFANWLDLILCMWAGFDVVVDPYTLAKKAQIVTTINSWIDSVVRHPQSFVVSADGGNQ